MRYATAFSAFLLVCLPGISAAEHSIALQFFGTVRPPMGRIPEASRPLEEIPGVSPHPSKTKVRFFDLAQGRYLPTAYVRFQSGTPKKVIRDHFKAQGVSMVEEDPAVDTWLVGIPLKKGWKNKDLLVALEGLAKHSKVRYVLPEIDYSSIKPPPGENRVDIPGEILVGFKTWKVPADGAKIDRAMAEIGALVLRRLMDNVLLVRFDSAKRSNEKMVQRALSLDSVDGSESNQVIILFPDFPRR